MTRHGPPPARAVPLDIAELKRVRRARPELAEAVDLQLALVDLHRRVQARLSLPSSVPDDEITARLSRGCPILQFEDIPLNWSDFRWVLRESSDLLRRHQLLDERPHARLQAIIREANALEPLVKAWFAATASCPASCHTGDDTTVELARDDLNELTQTLLLALRPFLSRCAERFLREESSSLFERWTRPYCPICGGGPELSATRSASERRLICERCDARWVFDAATCPFCGGQDLHVSQYAVADVRYRLEACQVCRRYLKGIDERFAGRPVLPAVDSIATLPLDAVAAQRGFIG